MVWATWFSLRASRHEGRWNAALAAGVLFGLAATMRQEAMIYGFVAGVALVSRLLASRQGRATVTRGLLMSGGFVAITAANAMVEDWVIGGATRTGRGAGTAVAAGRDITVRLREAIMTFGSPSASSDTPSLLVSLVLVALLVELGRRAQRSGQSGTADLRPVLIGLGAVVAATVVDLLTDGLRFIPGMIATTPVTALGLAALLSGQRSLDLPAWGDRRFVGAVAVVSLPLVWAVQYTGGAAPQWGGRYILLSGALLVTVAVASFDTVRSRRVLRAVALAGLAVTMLGVGWTTHRTRSFASAMQTLAEHDPGVLVFSDSHLAREGGALAYGAPWLAAEYEEGRATAAVVLDDLEITRIAFVQRDTGEAPFVIPGWTVEAREQVPLVNGLALLVTTQSLRP